MKKKSEKINWVILVELEYGFDSWYYVFQGTKEELITWFYQRDLPGAPRLLGMEECHKRFGFLPREHPDLFKSDNNQIKVAFKRQETHDAYMHLNEVEDSYLVIEHEKYNLDGEFENI